MLIKLYFLFGKSTWDRPDYIAEEDGNYFNDVVWPSCEKRRKLSENSDFVKVLKISELELELTENLKF